MSYPSQHCTAEEMAPTTRAEASVLRNLLRANTFDRTHCRPVTAIWWRAPQERICLTTEAICWPVATQTNEFRASELLVGRRQVDEGEVAGRWTEITQTDWVG